MRWQVRPQSIEQSVHRLRLGEGKGESDGEGGGWWLEGGGERVGARLI